MTRPRSESMAKYRSLLQKAVRRGNARLVVTVCALLESFGPDEKRWLHDRSAVIAFEECWPIGSKLVFNKRYHSKVAALVRTARAVKAKDAAGLGFLGYAHFKGDDTVIEDPDKGRDIRIIARALERPGDFWEWIDGRHLIGEAGDLVAHAHRYRYAGMPRDRAVIQAAAFLAEQEQYPSVQTVAALEQTFPYWVAFDAHTPEGRRVFKDIARDLYIRQNQLEWVSFFIEGAVTNEMSPSPWWDRYCLWRFQKLDLPMAEAHLLWGPVKPQVEEALADESHQLHSEIYQWKMANMDRVNHLRQQVDLFLERFDEVHKSQMPIF